MKKYDLIVIGSGPAGEKAAVKAAYFGHKVALIEKAPHYGGAGVNTGTMPSKTLKETALFLSGKEEAGLYGIERQLEHEPGVADFLFRKDLVLKETGREVKENIEMHGVEIHKGTASFVDDHHIHIADGIEETIYGEHIIIASGSYPVHPEGIPFDNKRILDSDTVLDIKHFPKSICVVGAGTIGCEYATIFSTMGAKVYLINRSDRIMPHVDREIRDHLLEQMHKAGIEILFNTQVTHIEVPKDPDEPVNIHLDTEGVLHIDMYLFAAGRNGNIKDLNLEKAGVKVGKRESILVDEQYRTNIPHIYAVGDVIGFPALASTSMDQGRAAVAHIFDTRDLEDIAKVLPYGIYTVPEVSMVGITEQEAQDKGLDYVTGIARHKDMARGVIMGVTSGMLKLVFTREDLVIRGVHVIGALATELIHFGLLCVQDQKTVMDIIATVFNHPTLHDLYKYAAYDGLCNLTGKKIKP